MSFTLDGAPALPLPALIQGMHNTPESNGDGFTGRLSSRDTNTFLRGSGDGETEAQSARTT